MFIHTVYFWLSDAAGDDVRQRMLTDCTELLAKIPCARHTWAGRAAMTPRDVVDNTYTIGLCVALEDSKAHDEYQVHPLHKEFLARYKQFWKRVQIYDFK
jgi:hypothetical protein